MMTGLDGGRADLGGSRGSAVNEGTGHLGRARVQAKGRRRMRGGSVDGKAPWGSASPSSAACVRLCVCVTKASYNRATPQSQSVAWLSCDCCLDSGTTRKLNERRVDERKYTASEPDVLLASHQCLSSRLATDRRTNPSCSACRRVRKSPPSPPGAAPPRPSWAVSHLIQANTPGATPRSPPP